MRGVLVALDRLADGREIAVRLIDGALDDLLVDPPAALGPAQPGAIFAARAERPMKGQGGVTVALGEGLRGFLREVRGIAPGTLLPVQVTTAAEPGKAAPVTRNLLFKSRHAIVTPGRPGVNVSRRVRDPDARARLAEIGAGAPLAAGDGLILRAAAAGAGAEDVAEDIARMVALRAETLDAEPTPGLRLAAPGAHELAWREWAAPVPDAVEQGPGAFDALGLWDRLDALRTPRVDLAGGGWMSVEETRALVAVDVNTAGDTSPAAGLKADIAALRALPAQLRLRGLGGQIVVDPAPYPKKDRKVLEQVLRAALRACPIETSVAGWTPLGHLELQRKRERRPLSEVLWP